MKLVEILAAEMEEWPDGVTHLTQSSVDREIYNALDGKDEDSLTSLDPRFDTIKSHNEGNYPIVTRAQWQAERDRQKGGEWKRHRAGRKQPLPDHTKIEVKFRDGEIHTVMSDRVDWIHYGHGTDLMQYRIISQPQAEEVEMKDTSIGTISYKISVDQIAGPLALRDTIIHCQAIIEDCEREIERNRQRLADEGFSLIQPITGIRASEPEIDSGDWRAWSKGDQLECVFSTCGNIYTVGSTYTVEKIEAEYAVVTDDTMGGKGTCHICDEDAVDIKFIRRP